MSMMNLSRAGLLLLIGLAACGGESTPPLVLTTLTVTLPSSSVSVGSALTATAAGKDQNGASISTGSVTWASSSPTVASITSAGQISALSAGTTQIIATAGGKAG